jgi:hypothetical protein
MNLLKRLFTLPPAEERRTLFSFSLQGTGGTTSTTQSDDTYIYYLLIRTSFFVALFFSLLNVDSQAFKQMLDFRLFVIDLAGPDYVKTFLLTYTQYTATVLLVVQLYYVVLFRVNIDPRTSTPSWVRKGSVSKKPMSRRRIWLLTITNLFAMIAFMYGLYAIYLLFMQGLGLDHSYLYFLFCVITMPFLMATGNALLLLVITVFWRHSRKQRQ